MQIKSVLLIISGSVAAYKALEVARLFQKRGVMVDAILTSGGQQFITPLAVSSLTGRETYTDLFSLKDEVEMGHIQLSRKADAMVVAPASADIMAKMTQGLCDDLATTALLATNKPVFFAPAMNHRMWDHAATQRNVEQLQQDGLTLIAPTEGDMACGEFGVGRMAEPEAIVEAVLGNQGSIERPLKGKRILVTAGPTHEPVDPVRYLANHSSGKQGIAIARSLAEAGAQVELVLGPTTEEAPLGVNLHRITTAQEMYEACQKLLPLDAAICTAAVADWRVESADHKIKKQDNGTPPTLSFTENPDILYWLANEAKPRPSLVVGFAAETENLQENANQKLARKQCDWLVANDVSDDKVFGKDQTQVTLLPDGEVWQGSKTSIADNLIHKITTYFEHENQKESA